MPAWPNEKLILMLSIFLGGGAACVLIVIKELLDTRVRSEEVLEQVTGSMCLGLIPRLRVKQLRPSPKRRFGTVAPRDSSRGDDDLSILPENVAPLTRLLQDKGGLLAHALRAVRLNIQISNGDARRGGQCIVFSSTFSGEGKSTLAALQALFIASTGARVLLIDADATNPALTRMFTPEAQRGLVDVVLNDQGERFPHRSGGYSAPKGTEGPTGCFHVSWNGRITYPRKVELRFHPSGLAPDPCVAGCPHGGRIH
jgi:succinoglycan biosynthesis transport protein ExoP